MRKGLDAMTRCRHSPVLIGLEPLCLVGTAREQSSLTNPFRLQSLKHVKCTKCLLPNKNFANSFPHNVSIYGTDQI